MKAFRWLTVAFFGLLVSWFPLGQASGLLNSNKFLLFSCVERLEDGSSPLGLGVRIEFDEETQVLEGVLLVWRTLGARFSWSKMGLDFL